MKPVKFLQSAKYTLQNAYWYCNLQSAICKVRTAKCELQSAFCKVRTSNCNLQSANCNLQSATLKVRTAKCNLQSAICKVQYAKCELQSAICKVPSAKCNLQSANCNLQSANCKVTRCNPQSARLPSECPCASQVRLRTAASRRRHEPAATPSPSRERGQYRVPPPLSQAWFQGRLTRFTPGTSTC